jgi:hypothetical protein
MELLNLVGVETRHGYRTFELYHGDITHLNPAVDVLAVSAFAGGYSPDRHTVFGALWENCGVDVRRLAENCLFDFRESLGCWVAKIDCESSPADRLLCVDMLGSSLDVVELIQNLFVVLSVLEMKGSTVRTLAIPVLGAGNQGLDPAFVIEEMLKASLRYLEQSIYLEKIQFVELNNERAKLLDDAMNKSLRRARVVVPTGKLVSAIRGDFGPTIDIARNLAGPAGQELFKNLRRIVMSEQSRSFELGIIGRRLTEFVCDDILSGRGFLSLNQKIYELRNFQIADWIISYMHVLRIFGNESAHEKGNSGRTPSFIDEADLALSLFCMQRLLDFWVGYRTSPPKMLPS